MKKIITLFSLITIILISSGKEKKNENKEKLVGNWVFTENPLVPIPKDSTYNNMSEADKKNYDEQMKTIIAAMVQIHNKPEGKSVWEMLGGSVEGNWEVKDNNYIFTGKVVNPNSGKPNYGRFEFRNIQWQGDTIFTADLYSTPDDKEYTKLEELPESKKEGKATLQRLENFEKNTGVKIQDAKNSLEQMFQGQQ